MAKDILITPASGSILLQTSTGVSNINLDVTDAGTSGSIVFSGDAGNLFSIVDSLTGSLMSVSDTSGIPILEVFSDDKVVMGEFGTNALVVTASKVAIGKDTPTADLDITGSVGITGSVNITGSMRIDGTTLILHPTAGGDFTINTATADASEDLIITTGAGNTDISLATPGTGNIHFDTAGSIRWLVHTNGHLYPFVTNTYNIGFSAQRVQTLYVNDVNATGNVSGSHIGDGSGLTGISAGLWTGSSGTITRESDVEITGSLRVTDSISGSFSGSFVGDGSGLTGVGTGTVTGTGTLDRLAIWSGSSDLTSDAGFTVSGSVLKTTGIEISSGNTLRVGTSAHFNNKIIFGDGDTSIGEGADDRIVINLATQDRFYFESETFFGAWSVNSFLLDSNGASATNPTFSPNRSYPNTGIGGTANTIAFISGSVSQWTINTSGNLIGLAGNSITATSLSGSFSGSFFGDGSGLTGISGAGGSGLWITGSGGDIYYNAGDVGIGTTNPVTKLHVLGTISGSGLIKAITFSGSAFSGSFEGDGSGLTGITISDTLQDITDNGNVTTNSITASQFAVTTGGSAGSPAIRSDDSSGNSGIYFFTSGRDMAICGNGTATFTFANSLNGSFRGITDRAKDLGIPTVWWRNAYVETISGSTTTMNIINVNSASGSFSGSFEGDGSSLTGISGGSSLWTGSSGTITRDSDVQITDGGTLSVSADTDITTILGRTKISSPVTNAMFISHFDLATEADYAIKQLFTGATNINAKLNQGITFTISGSQKWFMSSDGDLKAFSDQVFQLGRRNDPDPTGSSAGMMYYNNSRGTARLYDAGGWNDLITTSGSFTGSFTGSFFGDGGGLTGITTSDTLQDITDNGNVTTNIISSSNSIQTDQIRLSGGSPAITNLNANGTTFTLGTFGTYTLSSNSGGYSFFVGSTGIKLKPGGTNSLYLETSGNASFRQALSVVGALTITGTTNLKNNTRITGSTTITGSVVVTGPVTATSFSGSIISGSHVGDGSGLTGISGGSGLWSGSSGDITRVGDVHITGSLHVSSSDSSAPDIRLGTGGSGLRGHLGSVYITTSAFDRVLFTSNYVRSEVAGAWQLDNAASSTTNPTLIPNKNAVTTGIGGPTRGISLIIEGTETMFVTSSLVDITGSLTVTDGIRVSGSSAQTIKTAHVQLSQSEIQSLSSTPILFVSASGPGIVNQFLGATCYMDYNGTPYSGATTLQLQYNGGAVIINSSAAFINASEDVWHSMEKTSTSGDITPANTSLELTSNGDSTGAGGTVDVYMQYVQIDTN